MFAHCSHLLNSLRDHRCVFLYGGELPPEQAEARASIRSWWSKVLKGVEQHVKPVLDALEPPNVRALCVYVCVGAAFSQHTGRTR